VLRGNQAPPPSKERLQEHQVAVVAVLMTASQAPCQQPTAELVLGVVVLVLVLVLVLTVLVLAAKRGGRPSGGGTGKPT
jgi:hypothetical protein